MKKIVLMATAGIMFSLGILGTARAVEVGEGTNIGGNLKFYLFDRSQGAANNVSQNNNLTAGISHFILYVSKSLNDALSLDVQVTNDVTASATPALGGSITRATTPTSSTSLYQAFLSARLPKDAEMKIGMFKPMFSEEYAEEVFWNQQYHQNAGLCTLQSAVDTGIEVYKSFEFSNWALPTYFYAMNGPGRYNKYVDNNESKYFLLHLAPEFFQGNLRIPLSTSWGKWDNASKNDQYRHAAGFNWKYRKFNVAGEYLYNSWENVDVSSGTTGTSGRGMGLAKNQGYYVKGLYRFHPLWQGMVKYSHSELYATSVKGIFLNDTYEDTTFAVNYFITPSSTMILQYSLVTANRSDNSAKLNYDRVTLGWNMTF